MRKAGGQVENQYYKCYLIYDQLALYELKIKTFCVDSAAFLLCPVKSKTFMWLNESN